MIKMKRTYKHSFGTRNEPYGSMDKCEWESVQPKWRQVHGVAIAEVKAPQTLCGEVDGLWTSVVDQPIAVVTADCVSILLARRDLKAVACLHAGWRGVEQKIHRNFFKSLPESISNPLDWIALLGPSIRACCYEVSEELIAQFKNRFPELAEKLIEPEYRRLDLIAVLTADLKTMGVSVESTHPDCTFCTCESDGSPRYFSYRRGDRGARLYSFIQIAESNI